MADNLHKGWGMINDQQKGLEGGKYANIHNNSGVWTIGDEGLCSGAPNECEPYIDRKIGAKIVENTTDFDEFETRFGEITKIRYNTSCNEEMLVMWFNNDGRSGYNNYEYECILDDNHIFDIKNVDECTHLIYCQNGKYINTFRATHAYEGSSGSQKFPTIKYEDSGYPYISIAPCIGPVGNHSNYGKKYVSGNKYDGHKIKYRPRESTIPDSFYMEHDELVELYFPHLYDENNDLGKNTKVIGSEAFYRCSRLSAVTFSVVTAISEFAFAECGLKNIDWGHHISTGNCCESKLDTIGRYAFVSNLYLCYVNLPDSLREIGAYAFSRCGIMASDSFRLYIPSGVTRIYSYAFSAIGNSDDVKIRWDISDDMVGSQDTSFGNDIFTGGKMYVYLPNITCAKIDDVTSYFANASNVEFYIKSSSDNTCIGGNVHLLSDWNWPTDFPFDNPTS